MPRIEIIAPALDDESAIDLLRGLADDGYDVQAQGPQFGEDDINVLAEPAATTPHPDDMSPQDRRAWYQGNTLRDELDRARADRDEVRDDIAPTGWHVIARRVDPSV